MPEKPNPVVFVHGYSDKGASWAAWREILRRRLGLDNADMRTYVSRLLAARVEVQAVADGQAAIEAIRDRKGTSNNDNFFVELIAGASATVILAHNLS